MKPPNENADQPEPKKKGVINLEDLLKRANEARQKARQFLIDNNNLYEPHYIPHFKASKDPFNLAIDTDGVEIDTNEVLTEDPEKKEKT